MFGSSGLGIGFVQKHGVLKYPYRLNFYDKPPFEDITLDEFETFAIDRLRILSEIEASLVRNRTYDELKAIVKAQQAKYLPLTATQEKLGRNKAVESERRKDHISHFVLRLAFCRSEELRRRFVKAETTLFRVRYEMDDSEDRKGFLDSREFGWLVLSKEEERDEYLMNDLRIVSPGETSWYKVRWTRVPNLVEKRRVVLKGGWAYVPSKDQSSIVFQEFETRLEAALEQTARALPRLDEDTRLMPILEHLGQGFLSGMSVASEYTSADSLGDGEEVKAEMIDELAEKHWPMCMRHLHDCLRKDRHLKHHGRLQYGLFLKVVGLSIEEAIVFWRKAFGGRITDDKFNKEYKYNIRHSYGLEGKRTNYPAYTCQRIITQNQPGPQECHGCPYRHFSADRLQTALLATYGPQGLTAADLPEIMSVVKQEHYHVACTKVFEVTHGVPRGQGLDGESVSHPNKYAAKSRELEKAKAEASGAVKTEVKDEHAMEL
ncbi:DNA primase, large subunit [Fomitiporia mediterranea MF3/22]|uniref:DNA primase, large subunit n=1 Tax=Fomitiporia mediterranea (strain MF3/22) TaxID=694068 RepID=UPI0004408621|nr:DNA primase, large subunit [Fomitiporia mediterranea MF3/22]EJD05813.1 DNA primase, large subunit [Fomitiporia mediterranea MF3/22]